MTKKSEHQSTMPMKKWFQHLEPLQLYIILILTVLFFITELICSHITHALTLLMDSYHMLCNIMALTGCIITIKYGKESRQENKEASNGNLSEEPSLDTSGCQDKKPKKSSESPARTNQERKLRNTFGWARIDVISMLICCIFMASLSFSVLVEALQTLVHIDHLDEMHHPLSVLFIGAAGLLLNGVCYLLIGGYTFHQGSFLFVTENGDVVLNRVIIPDVVKQGGRRLSRTRTVPSSPNRQRQGFWEMCKDVLGCVIVIICALLVFFTEKNVAKYIDPILSLVSAASLMLLSYPYMKESCLILLQTLPGSINIDILKKDLLCHFPDIVNVHDFHVWQLTATKIISTVHIIFQHQKGYSKLMEDIKEFLIEYGITQVTIQPEFFTKTESTQTLAPLCLMQCQGEGCKLSHCCPIYQTESEKHDDVTKDVVLSSTSQSLVSVKVIDGEESKSTETNLTDDKTQS